VRALAFATRGKDEQPLLVSAARGRDANDKYVGEVVVWDVLNGKKLRELTSLPDPQPGAKAWPRQAVSAWFSEAGVGAALAGGDGTFRLWRPGTPAVEVQDGFLNGTVALLPDGKRLLTGGLPREAGRQHGRLQGWNPTGKKPVALPGSRIEMDEAPA